MISDDIFKNKIMTALNLPINDFFSVNSPLKFSIKNPLNQNSQSEKNESASTKIDVFDKDIDNDQFIKSYRLNGPPSILNEFSRFSSYYFSLPHTFKVLFPSLSSTFKILSHNGIVRLESIKINELIENDAEISLFGIVFITAVSGVILHNILKND